MEVAEIPTKSLLIHCCDRKAGNWGGADPWHQGVDIVLGWAPIRNTKSIEKSNWFEKFMNMSDLKEYMDIQKKNGWSSNVPEK